jgi:hypothetical protein
MNVLPCAAKRGYVLLKLPLYAGQINSGEAIVFSQRDGANRTVKSKDGFMTRPSRSMILKPEEWSKSGILGAICNKNATRNFKRRVWADRWGSAQLLSGNWPRALGPASRLHD